MAEALGDDELEAAARTSLGRLLVDTSDFSPALSALRRAVEFRTPAGGEPLDQSQLALAYALTELGEYDEALKLWQQGMFRAFAKGNRGVAGYCMWGVAGSHFKAGRYKTALVILRQIVEVGWQLLRGLSFREVMMAREQCAGIFGDGFVAATKIDDVESACFFLEAGRADGLLAALGGREALEAADVPEALAAEEQRRRGVENETGRAVRQAVARGRQQELETARAAHAAAQAELDAAVANLAAVALDPLGLDPACRRILVSPHGPLALARDVARVRWGRVLAALPATRAEARSVGDVVLLGKEASETAFRRRITEEERWRSIHLACHGLVDVDDPRHSALALTADGENDGFVTVLDVLRLRIPADLVVLSACDTAQGRVRWSEGTEGFPRAFLFAGASRVIVSLWKVDDDATRALMERFYELWRPRDGSEGIDAARALRLAQESVRTRTASEAGGAARERGPLAAADDLDGAEHADHPWAHPYHWAAWVLWGLP